MNLTEATSSKIMDNFGRGSLDFKHWHIVLVENHNSFAFRKTGSILTEANCVAQL